MHVVQHQSMQACNIAIGDFILEKIHIWKKTWSVLLLLRIPPEN